MSYAPSDSHHTSCDVSPSSDDELEELKRRFIEAMGQMGREWEVIEGGHFRRRRDTTLVSNSDVVAAEVGRS